MIVSGIVLVLVILLGVALLFMPLSIKLASKTKNEPPKEAHDYEDIRKYLVEDDQDLSVHYHINNEGTNTIL